MRYKIVSGLLPLFLAMVGGALLGTPIFFAEMKIELIILIEVAI